MTRWPGVVWTETQQVFALLGWPVAPDDRDPPATTFAELRECKRTAEAVKFLAMALPRYEAVRWAAQTVREQGAPLDLAVMRAIDDWLHDPSDARRRAARASTGAHGHPTPESLCATAIFMSGGSIVAEDQPRRQPPREATGKFAAMAVIATADAAMRAPGAGSGPAAILARRQAALDRALDAGLRFAEQHEREMA